MKEIWKDIPNFDGYQVSNCGRVRTYNKITFTNKHNIRHWKIRILIPKVKNNKMFIKLVIELICGKMANQILC